MKKVLYALPAIALIAAGCTTSTTTNTDSTTPPPAATQNTTPNTSTGTTNNSQTNPPTETPTNQATNVTVTASNFSFNPSTIRVKKGDRVKIILQNQSGSHDWVVDEFNARTKVIQGGPNRYSRICSRQDWKL